MLISETIFYDYYSYRGGALLIDTKNITISKCTFKKCKATNGGAANIVAPKEMNILYSNFENNYAEVLSGALLIESSTVPFNKYRVEKANFSSNEAPSVSAFDFWSGNSTIDGCLFLNNSSTYSFGSLRVSSKTPEEVSVENSMFIENKSKKKGSAVSIYWFASCARISFSSFIRNENNPIVITNNRAICKVIECTFDTSRKEAIVSLQKAKITIDDSSFSE